MDPHHSGQDIRWRQWQAPQVGVFGSLDLFGKNVFVLIVQGPSFWRKCSVIKQNKIHFPDAVSSAANFVAFVGHPKAERFQLQGMTTDQAGALPVDPAGGLAPDGDPRLLSHLPYAYPASASIKS